MVEQSEFENKLEYIARHSGEMLPTSSHAAEIKTIIALVRDVEECHGGVWRFADKSRFPQTNVVEAILEEAETKVLTYENPDAQENAKRILFTMDNPGAFSALMPIVFSIKHDVRCKSIEILASNTAAEYVKENEGGDWFGFKQIRSANRILGKPAPVFIDAFPESASPPDIVFASFTTSNGPESVALFGAKSVLGADKLYYVADAWGGFGKALASKERMDTVDGIFCNDELAKKITEKEYPEYPPEHIYTTGTGQIDSLELKRADELGRVGREKTGVSGEAIAVLYIGDISEDYRIIMENSDPDISEKTFANVLMSMIELAKRDKDKLLVLMVRPHPRAVRSKELWDAVASSKLPSNLSVVSAARNICKDINEAAYAADVIVSILSTENFKAPLRGRTSAFLGFSESGMGKDALERMYSPEILSAVREMSGLAIVSSKDELVRWLIQQKRAEVPSKQNEKQKSASEQIIEIAFAD